VSAASKAGLSPIFCRWKSESCGAVFALPS
jgi:hypothetical protein